MIRNLFSWLFQAPPTLPPPVAVERDEPPILVDDIGTYYERDGRLYRWSCEAHRRLCRLMVLSNRFPKKGTIARYEFGVLSLHDRETGHVAVLKFETIKQYKLALDRLHAARAGMLSPTAIDGDSTP